MTDPVAKAEVAEPQMTKDGHTQPPQATLYQLIHTFGDPSDPKIERIFETLPVEIIGEIFKIC